MKIFISRRAKKQFDKLPSHIQAKFGDWVELILAMGMERTRLLKGYHDEPLKGDRRGQRSARLSKSYRVIYFETKAAIEVLEVNKHDY